MVRATRGCDVVVHAVNPPCRRRGREVPAPTRAALEDARASGATPMVPDNVCGHGPGVPPVPDAATPDASSKRP